MIAHAHRAFWEADAAYRRDRLAADFRGTHRTARSGWLRRIRETLRDRNEARRPAAEATVLPDSRSQTSYIRPATSSYR